MAVTVWSTSPWFVKVTAEPVGMLRDSGMNASFVIANDHKGRKCRCHADASQQVAHIVHFFIQGKSRRQTGIPASTVAIQGQMRLHFTGRPFPPTMDGADDAFRSRIPRKHVQSQPRSAHFRQRQAGDKPLFHLFEYVGNGMFCGFRPKIHLATGG